MVVTGSDDKTMAVWDATTFDEISRTQAHDSLVNFLFWERATGSLWSSSSDTTLKRWTWPSLEQVEVIRAGDHGKASFWVDSARKMALVGTWGHAWLDLREDGGWHVEQRVETTSPSVYCVVELEALEAVLLLGAMPTNVWLYDLQSMTFSRLHDLDSRFGWAVPLGRDRIIVFGENGVASYRFARTSRGIEYELSVGLNTDLGMSWIGATAKGGERAVIGTDDGRLLFVDPEDIPEAVLARGVTR
jgi:WD40 repeat protein